MASRLLPDALIGLSALSMVAFIPSAPTLARRVAVNLACLLGWVPILWWAPWPFPIAHGALVWALSAGSLVVLGNIPTPARRWSRLRPVVQWSDLMLVLSAGVALFATQKWAFTRSPQAALEVLVPGADNYAHFNIFTTVLSHGATVDALGTAPDGSEWAFANYPQSFHAIAATITELTRPDASTGPPALVAYTHALSIVVVLGTVLLVAAVLSLPGLSKRPEISVPILTLVLTAFLWEPGQKVLANGFANFWLGALAAAVALLLSMSPSQPRASSEAVAVGGLLICVAHTWTPLVILAAPAALALMTTGDSLSRVKERRRRSVIRAVVLGVSALLGGKAIVTLLASVEVAFIVSEVSGFDGTSPLPTLVLLVATLYLGLVFPCRMRGRGRELEFLSRRVRILVLSPVLGVASLSILLVAQLQALGTTSYYFLKYLLGFELVLAALAPALCGVLLASTLRPAVTRWRPALTGLGVAAAATQCFGHLPMDRALLFSDTDDGTAAIRAPYSRSGIARGVLSAVDSTSGAESFSHDYLPLGTGNAAHAFYPDGWYHAVNASVTTDVFDRYAILRREILDVDGAVPVVRRLLSRDSGLRILVPPAYLEPLRARLHPSRLRVRIVPFEPAQKQGGVR